jgi:hypothetical protein
MNEEPNFARRRACDFGKATQELKTKVDEQTEYLWLRLCAERGMTTAELMRDFVFLAVYDKTHSRIIAEQKLRELERNEVLARVKGPSQAPEFREDRNV